MWLIKNLKTELYYANNSPNSLGLNAYKNLFIMNLTTLIYLLKADYARLPQRGGGFLRGVVLNKIFSESFNIILWFRLGNYFISKDNIVAKLCGAFCRIKLLRKGHRYGISLKLGTLIGGVFLSIILVQL